MSVLYHALQGAQTYEQYQQDARKAGDSELERFFDECKAEEVERAERAKSLLLDRLEDEGADAEDDSDEDAADDEEEDDDEES